MRTFTGILVFALMLGGVLQGCGYRLAGSSDVGEHLQNVSVNGGRSSTELVHLTRDYLGSNQVSVVESDDAAMHLDIVSEEVDKEVLTLDAYGKAREYDLVLSVLFDVKHADNSEILPRQGIRLNRVLVFDKYDVLGSDEEEQQLLHEMRRDMAQMIVHRLRAIPPN
ncbi:MAG: LPS assembly lipoprotein LptE [Gammaproteobacteria bacterium]|nr:LPS assembly lipoprotein LptE [Gammaproteobacteria bacterium]